MKVLHVRLEAFTSTFKIPFVNSGVMVSAPVPSFSNIVGIISCCKGSWIQKDETMIGFTYNYEGTGRDLETTRRLGVDKKGILKRVKQNGIAIREFHVNPILDLYLSNIKLRQYFEQPVGVPTLGRSQDITWITEIEEIDIQKKIEGKIKQTLIPFPCEHIGGRVIRYSDYFQQGNIGEMRQPDRMTLYQVVPQSEDGVYIRGNNLYAINNDEVIYMHTLGDEKV